MTDKDRIEQLERHLSIMVSTANDLLDRLVNACEGFDGDEQFDPEEREETQEHIDEARSCLFAREARE